MIELGKRYDSSVVELMKWYEAIFGGNLWNHLVIETSFWSHSEENSKDRQLNRNVSKHKWIKDV